MITFITWSWCGTSIRTRKAVPDGISTDIFIFYTGILDHAVDTEQCVVQQEEVKGFFVEEKTEEMEKS